MNDAMTAAPDVAPNIIPDIDLGLPGDRATTRVIVAMSGGVDSSVTAALLKHAGYDVAGITLQLYDHGAAINKAGSCCAGQDIHDARRVAAALDIPHYVLDYEGRFRKDVMDYFADSYLAGETPIPCVRCNQGVKFRDLLDMARDLGAACMATGHYVRRVMGEDGAQLHRAADATRDQSYFLFATTRAQLDFLRFPLGDMPNKALVRDIGAALGVKTAEKPDSQDICFVPTGKYQQVVEKLRPGALSRGEIVHTDGRVLGKHEGVINYTIGQRRGLNIAVGEPLFVVRLDAPNKRVIVGPREALMVSDILLKELNWLSATPIDGQPVLARVRSTRAPVPGRLRILGERLAVSLDIAEEGVAPGQACVFYDAQNPNRVLGGGWIAGALA